MSFLRHGEPHQPHEQPRANDLLNEWARPFGHAHAHRADESPAGCSWRVALQQSPLPLNQPRLIVRKRSVEGNNFFVPVLVCLNWLSHSWGAPQRRIGLVLLCAPLCPRALVAIS
jgi:hypothetical protein